MLQFSVEVGAASNHCVHMHLPAKIELGAAEFENHCLATEFSVPKN
jgi:hypothetical protein